MTFERLALTRAQIDKFGRIRRLEQLQKLDPVEFEQFCGYLYERQGYKAHMTATSGDEGVDLLLTKNGKKEVVQCKRYQGSVGQPTVRDMYGTMLHTNSVSAAVVTTGRFTKAAEAWAANKPIQLIDGYELMSWVNRERRSSSMGSSSDSSGSWFSSNVGKISLVALALIAVSLCLFSLRLGIQTFQERTARTAEGPSLAVPTLPVTATAIVTESAETQPENESTEEPSTETTGTPELAPTVTLRSTATAPAGNVTERFEISPVDDFSLSTSPTQWEAINAVSPTHIVEQEGTWDGSQDISALFKLAYDADALYGYVVIEDDVHVQINSPRTSYLGDSIELEIDTLGDRAGQAGVDDYQYIISPGDFGSLQAGAFRFQGNANGTMADAWGTRAEVQSTKTADGYILAFRIPWFDMNMSRKAVEGTTIGITLNVNDNDDVGTSKQELMLSNVAGRRWSRPNTWGTMTLGE
ncbi:MAG: restriction endonuclease [Candidatus Promineifilaceae bacterium]